MGEILVDSGVVFGPALVKSYKLESEYAVYPRIVIDRDFLAAVRNAPKVMDWSDYVRQGDDGAWYLDYLFGAILNRHQAPTDVESPETVLDVHQEIIEAAIKDDIRKKDERIRQKYMWLPKLFLTTEARQLRTEQLVVSIGCLPANCCHA